MYKDLFVLDGTLEKVEDINKAITDLTGDEEPFFDSNSEEWRAWIEYRDGKTVVLTDTVD